VVGESVKARLGYATPRAITLATLLLQAPEQLLKAAKILRHFLQKRTNHTIEAEFGTTFNPSVHFSNGLDLLEQIFAAIRGKLLRNIDPQ
jgi:hypothetical protein